MELGRIKTPALWRVFKSYYYRSGFCLAYFDKLPLQNVCLCCVQVTTYSHSGTEGRGAIKLAVRTENWTYGGKFGVHLVQMTMLSTSRLKKMLKTQAQSLYSQRTRNKKAVRVIWLYHRCGSAPDFWIPGLLKLTVFQICKCPCSCRFALTFTIGGREEHRRLTDWRITDTGNAELLRYIIVSDVKHQNPGYSHAYERMLKEVWNTGSLLIWLYKFKAFKIFSCK